MIARSDDDPAILCGVSGDSHASSLGKARPAWLNPERIRETQRVWGIFLGREVTEAEAMDMLVNVRRFVDVIAKATHKSECGRSQQ